MPAQSVLQCRAISKLGIKIVKGFYLKTLLEQDMACKVSWKHVFNLVRHMPAGRNSKNVIEFFERPLLGLVPLDLD